MKVVILAGGLGSRLSEETAHRPKPLIQIGGRPILWHIMMHYAASGFRDFVVATGYKGEMVREYLDGVRVGVGPGAVEARGWRVEVVDTGPWTKTGGRLRQLAPLLRGETFFMTWADGVSDVDLRALLAFHRGHGRMATVTAVHPPPRFGRLTLDGDRVTVFAEKPEAPDEWVSGAFFVLEPSVLPYIAGDGTSWEHEPMERLVREGQLMAYRHDGFWQCMDTARDREVLESRWFENRAPWKIW